MRYEFGLCRLDTDRFELWRGNEAVHVEPQVFDVLRYLVEHRDHVVSKDELLDAVWGSRFVTESALTSRIKAARQALGDDGTSQTMIRTVRGRGFRFVAAVLVDDGSRDAPDVTPREEPDAPSEDAPPAWTPFPHLTSPLVGRTDAIAAVADALRRSRLVTIVGPGGVGKTSLAIRVAEVTTERFRDGSCWCDWASVRDAGAVAGALADALGMRRQPGLSTEQSLMRGIGDRSLLVVADNCEHVVDEAARLLEQLVTACRNLSVLATSRSPLAVASEQLVPLAPLDLSSASGDDPDAGPSAAGRLFAERAAAVHPSFVVDKTTRPLVEEICRRLDGLPLALELAAARLRFSTITELAEQLAKHVTVLSPPRRGAVPRHQTLHATVDWSYQLLTADERWLFDRLWVFAGGFTVADATGLVAHLGGTDRDVGADLAGLVDHSMVGADRSGSVTRYSMLETLRAFGQALSSPDAAEALRDAHAEWAAELAERLDAQVRGQQERFAVTRFDQEFANLRSALLHAVRRGRVATAFRLVAGLHLCGLHRLRDEVVSWSEAAAGMSGASEHELYPVVLGCFAQGLANRGELRRAHSLAQQALDACPERDRRALWALRTLCNVALYEGRLTDVLTYGEQELAIARAAGDDGHASYALVTHVLANAYSDRPDDALAWAREQQRHAERSANPTQLAWARYSQGEALRTTSPDVALEHFAEALVIGELVDSNFVVGVTLVSVASTRARLGQVADALETFARIIDHWHRRGDWTHQWTTLRNVAPLLHDAGRNDEAAVLLGAVTGVHAGAPAYGDTSRELAELADLLGESLGSEQFAACLQRGRSMTPDQTLAFTKGVIAAGFSAES